MAAPKVNISFDVSGIESFNKSLKALADSGAFAAAIGRALSGVAKDVSKQFNGGEVTGDSITISRADYKALTEKYARCSERMSVLLSMISTDELKRIGLLDADATVSDIDGFDRVVILNALDAKVQQFNQAHQRLTGKRKRVPDPGRMELSQEEMARVFAAKQAGIPTKDIVEEIKAARTTKTIRL